MSPVSNGEAYLFVLRRQLLIQTLFSRTRKIRCDGAKPVCHNCGRRTTGNNECTYDPVPKRRGPDKTPGARQRMARDVRNQLDSSLLQSRRRRRTRDVPSLDPNDTIEYSSSSLSPPSLPQQDAIALPISLSIPPAVDTNDSKRYDACPLGATSIQSTHSCGCHGLSPCPDILGTAGFTDNYKARHPVSGEQVSVTMRLMFPFQPPPYGDAFSLSTLMSYNTHPIANHGYITELDENGNERTDDRSDMVSQPSLVFTRDVWWESLLLLYMSPNSTRLQALSPAQRESAAQGIASDLRFVFKASNYWFSFFHIPTFFGNFFDPVRRKHMQPSLVLALLAMSTFWQSSEVGLGLAGRERALRFRDEAQSALEASVNVGWLDETLAQAAWVSPESLVKA